MNNSRSVSLFCSYVATLAFSCLGTDRFVSPRGIHQPPFASWESAATNLQAAVDAGAAGDTIWVTNGVYADGGKAKSGDLTNRIAIDKAMTVRSVNGPAVTIIQGAWDPVMTNGTLAVRCAWLTNGAVLNGFTLQGGATRSFTDSSDLLRMGGGVWGSSTNAMVINCVISNNSAGYSGGGAFQVSLSNCVLTLNRVIRYHYAMAKGEGGAADSCGLRNCTISDNFASYQGGGAIRCALRGCLVVRNLANSYGGGTESCNLVNCTLSGNRVGDGSVGGAGGGSSYSTLVNCLLYENRTAGGYPANALNNQYQSTLTYCCSSPLASGPGNIDVTPQLIGSGARLSAASPCRGVGDPSAALGADIDGQFWANPPSMGCDEWWPTPVFSSQPAIKCQGIPVNLGIGKSTIAGQDPFSFLWLKDGMPLEEGPHYSGTATSELTVNVFTPTDRGAYQLLVSNTAGVCTSAVMSIVVHCVDAASSDPHPPFSDWATAASTIQDAIDVSMAGDIVLVTNGVYSSGGRAMAGDLTNRVAVDRPLILTSVNGSAVTTILGAWHPGASSGPLAVRCAWVTAPSMINGFTLRHGAVRTSGESLALQYAGGIWCSSTNATVANCVIADNVARWGGGVYSGSLYNCLLQGNTAFMEGGGANSSALFNCTVISNSTALTMSGGGISGGSVRNCLVYFNLPLGGYSANWSALYASTASYTCTTPSPGGTSIITDDPKLVDSFHLASASRCRNAGSPAFGMGVDLDGEEWANPPSMGCDEVWETALTGALSVTVISRWPEVAQGGTLQFWGQITGRASSSEWSFGDNTGLTNASYLNISHAWTNPGDYTVTFTAYNLDHPLGVTTNIQIRVLPLIAPTASSVAISAPNFSVCFPTQPGGRYLLDRATNLNSPTIWQTVRTGTGDGRILQLTDTQATNAAAFYRLGAQ